MRVLVTGAAGRIGRAVMTAMTDDPGIRVTGSSRHATPPAIPLDITRPSDVNSTIAEVRPDTIVHLAGLVGASCETDRERAEAVNVDAVRTLAASATRAGVRRIVFASTAAIYGDRSALPIAESAPLDPRSAYARTKAAAEDVLCRVASTDDGPEVVILRIFNLWGDEFPESLATRALSSGTAEPIVFWGRQAFIRDYVHLDDVVAGVLLSVTAPLEDACTILNIGSGVATDNDRLIAEAQRRGHPFSVVEGTPSVSVADISRARRLIGYAPKRLL